MNNLFVLIWNLTMLTMNTGHYSITSIHLSTIESEQVI